MLIFKLFNSRRKLDSKQYRHFKYYGMALVRNERDVPFVECTTAQAGEALKQGREIIGISAISFFVPFTSLGTEVRETRERVNVSGAVKMRINPNASFREFVLSHGGSALTTNQIAVEFARGLELNLEPYLRHVVNTDNVEQLRKHGVDAADISALPNELPDWCEIEKVILSVDGTAIQSRFADEVAKAMRAQEGDFIERFFNEVLPEWRDSSIDELKKGPAYLFATYRKTLIAILLVAVFGVWALRLVVFIFGGGSPFDRTCRIDFENGWFVEDTASSNLQKYMLEQHLAKQFTSHTRENGKPFGGFDFGETYHLAEEDAVKLREWVDSYVNEHRGVLQKVNSDYNQPQGLARLLGWSTPYYYCTVGMEGKLNSEKYQLIVENDDDNAIKRHLDNLLLCKGKKKDEVVIYNSLELRPRDIQLLEHSLKTAPELAGRDISVFQGATPQEIRVSVNTNNIRRSFVLDASQLNDELKSELQKKIQIIFPKVFFNMTDEVKLVFTNSDFEKIRSMFAKDNRIAFRTIAGEKGQPIRLLFEMSEKMRKERELEQKNIQQKNAWWEKEEQILFDATLKEGKLLTEAVQAIKIPNDAEDSEYASRFDMLQKLRNRLEGAVDAMQKLRYKCETYKVGMEGKILNKANDHVKQLVSLAVTYSALKKQIDSLSKNLDDARWQAKVHKELARRRTAIGKVAEEAEKALETERAAYQRDIPKTVQTGQPKQTYDNLEQIAQQLKTKCREMVTRLEKFRDAEELKETFMLENKSVKMDVTDSRKRVNIVLEGWKSFDTQLNRLTTDIDNARWQTKVQNETARRRTAIGKVAEEAEKALETERAAYQRDIPKTVQTGQPKQTYDNLEQIAQQLKTKCREMVTRLEKFRDAEELKETFMLENKSVKMDVTDSRKRVNIVLESWKSFDTQLNRLTTDIDNARWQTKVQNETARRRTAIGKVIEEAEKALETERAAFQRDIPKTVQTGQAIQSYAALEKVAQQWDSKCREAFTQLENYRNAEIKDTFMLENKSVKMDVTDIRKRVNTVLEGWADLCVKALSCKHECKYQQLEIHFREKQAVFWKNVEELNALGQDIRACNAKLQAKRQELAGLSMAEARNRKDEIKTWFNTEIVLPKKDYMKRARTLEAYFSSQMPKDGWDSANTYDRAFGRGLMASPEVTVLSAACQEKVKALVEEQENRLLGLNMGPRRKCLEALRTRAENMQGMIENLTYFEPDDKFRKILNMN